MDARTARTLHGRMVHLGLLREVACGEPEAEDRRMEVTALASLLSHLHPS